MAPQAPHEIWWFLPLTHFSFKVTSLRNGCKELKDFAQLYTLHHLKVTHDLISYKGQGPSVCPLVCYTILNESLKTLYPYLHIRLSRTLGMFLTYQMLVQVKGQGHTDLLAQTVLLKGAPKRSDGFSILLCFYDGQCLMHFMFVDFSLELKVKVTFE